MPITLRILSRIKSYLALHWRDIGYELIADHKVEIIASSSDNVEEKCFTMLKTWLETDTNPCYCKLFSALERYEYFNTIRKLKGLLATS